MKELDYIIATDLAKVRMIRGILFDIVSENNPHTGDEDYKGISRILAAWEQAMFRAFEWPMDWIKTSDQLPPEEYESVLGYNIEKDVRGLTYWFKRNDVGIVWCWNGRTGPNTTEPDYWWSLPDQPAIEEDSA